MVTSRSNVKAQDFTLFCNGRLGTIVAMRRCVSAAPREAVR
jgi:hypothetical protein